MAHTHKGTLNEAQARLEHKMAVNRDYIFQPRMCKFDFCQIRRTSTRILKPLLFFLSLQDCFWCQRSSCHSG